MTQSPTRTEAAVLRPQRFAREHFAAWRAGHNSPRGEAIAIDVSRAGTLREAEAIASNHVQHKDGVFIVAGDTVTGKRMMHVYAVKQRREPPLKWNSETQKYDKQPREYLAEVIACAVNDFAPVEPWKWEPGSDPVGIDRQEVRQ